ncbi:MAG TPA: AMP-binding protein [Methylomirabilota bacterium]|jgi:fatty-acyl-CoA synthase|nr:AMP-binding protein [Methylomirabilota bacterium]
MEPPRSRTLGDLLDEMARRYPDGEAVVFERERLTYREYRERVRRLARGLHQLGVRRGDKVALLMGNRTEWLLVDFAVALLGATLVPVSTWSTARELEYVLRHADATTLVTVDRFRGQDYLGMLAALGPGSERLPLLRHVVCLGGERRPGITPFAELWELGARGPEAVVDAAQRAVAPTDIAYILYTSGTTSTPKGVQLQHRGLIENMFNIGERQHLGPADRLWLGISLFWGFGCENALLAVMTHGGCVVLQEAFEPGEALALIERERCTVYYGTPNVALALWEHPDRPHRNLGSLRTGAAIGHPPAMQMVMDLGAREICNVYGLTECYGNCTLTDAHDPVEARLSTIGRPLPGFEIKIADPVSHHPLRPGEIGEITLRGYITPGYYKDPEKNAAAFDAEGFFLTGDLGWFDTDGRLRFHGRLKDVVKTGGLNVSPVEVEQILLGHPAVEQVHVIGVPDPRKEEALAAVVVLKEGASASADELRAFCRQALAAFKVPQHIRFVPREALPLTASGKVQKHRLRESLAAELEGVAADRRVSAERHG